MLERELRFRISEEDGPGQIKDVLERAGFQLTPSGALTHEDRYLDTEDRLLHRAGLSLRLRRDGPDLRLEAKTVASKSAESTERLEWSQPAPEREPPWSHLPEGEVQGLLDPLASLHAVSRLGVRAGLEDAAGIQVPELDESAFTPHQSDRLADVAVKNMGRQLARMFWYEPGTRVGVDPEYVHDMRVATRRLRTALLVFADVIPEKARLEWQRELRWIGLGLGRVRDCDVELDRVKRMAADAPNPERSALLIFANRVQIKRARRRAKLLKQLDSPRFMALKALARPWIEMRADSALVRNGDGPAYIAGPRIVSEWDARMLAACRTAEQIPTAENVHALRISIKHLRYAVEYFADLEGHGAKHRAKQLGRLQNILGARQDAAILLRHIRRYEATIPEEDRDLLLGARSAIEKIDRAARVKKSELQQVLKLGADQELP